jgi:hypothetical protein
MWILFDLVLLAIGYIASIYSWPAIRVWANGVAEEADRLRARAERLEAEFRDI